MYIIYAEPLFAQLLGMDDGWQAWMQTSAPIGWLWPRPSYNVWMVPGTVDPDA